jgi:exopolysaccharide biosynthesis polyprenyl glycosylphosphotransferase
LRSADTAIAVLVLLAAFLASNIARMPAGLQQFLEMRLTIKNILMLAAFAVAWRVVCFGVGLYNDRVVADRRQESLRILGAVSAASAVASIFPAISVSGAFGHLAIAYYWVGSVLSMLLGRSALRAILKARSAEREDVIIVGTGPRALRLYRQLAQQHDSGPRVLGFVDSPHGQVDATIGSRLLGDVEGLEKLLMERAVDEVLIALPTRSRYADIQRTIEICERGGVPVQYLADVFESRRSGPSRSESLVAVPTGVAKDDPRLLVKRAADIFLGSVALVLSAPIVTLAVVAMKVTSPGPVLFVQERYGLNKRMFRMYKLRTMVVEAEALQPGLEARNEAKGPVFKIRQDPRVTPVGRLLRRLSIDELPQLLNVIRGDMSLVGPRPLPPRDVRRFSEPALMRRFSVRPGVTGLWQVSGRSELDFDDWIRLDLQYIDEWSLALEARILLRTVPTVLRGTGAV